MNTALIEAGVKSIKERTKVRPKVCIVLGSGLGRVAEMVEEREVVRYDEIAGFPRTSVDGHEGRLVLGKAGEVAVGVLQGRVHLYEGASAEEVVRPVRVLIRLGATIVILTNAAGGINEQLQPGDLMCIDDHINLQWTNPLVGENDDTYGPRFPDMSCVYDRELRGMLDKAAETVGVTLRHGVYAGLLGPSYETPAEVRMLRVLGADAVGMSTVGEAIAARHMGARVCGLSLITNRAAGLGDGILNHEEVKRVGALAAQKCANVILRMLESLSECL